MYSLPNFCRVCLKYDKNLIDLAHIENEPSETLMSKLEQCVSEVDWTAYKPLLCHPCIKRLNAAFSFKKQCVQSASVLKSYLELVRETQKKNESQNATAPEATNTSGAYMVLPNQKYVKIVVGGQQQQNSSFQNVFLNLIPTPGVQTPAVSSSTQKSSNISTTKDTNQNVFINLSNTMQKFVPIAPGKPSGNSSTSTNTGVNQLLKETKTEELSVEIDPTIYGLGDDSEYSANEEEANDWDEVISQSQINSKDLSKLNGDKAKLKDDKLGKGNLYGNYVPILPKHGDFVSSGQHFLFSEGGFEDPGVNEYGCEQCNKHFATVKMLKYHIKLFHMGKYPFKCEICHAEYVTRFDYELCVGSHKPKGDGEESTLTLKDFTDNSPNSCSQSQSLSDVESNLPPQPGEEGMIFSCELCKRQFNSSTGLLRHKVRKHNQKNRKKYFIKGMKNAKCDICNREFSTQSYMQLHRKLHMRDDIGYKYKVFGKSKYAESEGAGKQPHKKKKLDQAKDSDKNNLDSKSMDESDSENEKPSFKSRKLNSSEKNKEEKDDDSDDNNDKVDTDDDEDKDEGKSDDESESVEVMMEPEIILDDGNDSDSRKSSTEQSKINSDKNSS